MGALFGKSKKPKSRVTDQDRAILQLKQQRDRLKQYQKRIEMSLEKDRELAKKCLHMGRKERAKLLLRKKKYQEKLIENTDVQLENLQKLASDIEFAQIESEVVDKLRLGNEALKKVNALLNIDEIERIMDETKEGAEKQEEITLILSGALTDQDEEDVLAELDELASAEDKAKTKEESKPEQEDVRLPDVPEDEPIVVPQEQVKEKPKRLIVEA